MTETQTLQTWPGGQSFEYRGDVHGPAEQRELRAGYTRDAEWRAGTDDEWRLIRVSRMAQIYADRDVLACQSALVDDLIKAEFEGFGIDDIENLTPNASDWDANRCREWLDDHGIAGPDKPTVSCPDCAGSGLVDSASDESCAACLGSGDLEDHDADEDDSRHGYLTELRDCVNDHAEPADVFEWWLVTSWLCDQLRAIGEVVIDNGSGHWWGRCCTGQGFLMDGTLQQIAASFDQD